MTDRSKSDERKAAKKDEAKAVLNPTDPDPEVAQRLYEAKQEQAASREKSREAEKLKAKSAQTAFGVPQMIHKSAPNEVVPGIEPSVKSATVDKDGNIKVTGGQ